MDIPVMPTYHPAFILRNPARERQLKGQVWEDVKEIMARLGLEVKKDG
jgi:DNA polymerase